jgi:enolase-phosphatase E1
MIYFMNSARDFAASSGEGRGDAQASLPALAGFQPDVGVRIIPGLIWTQGFASGDLCSDVFADVPLALRRWWGQNRTVATHSCDPASVQKSFLRYTEWGDLTTYISFFLDWRTGAPDAVATYWHIWDDLRCFPSEVRLVSNRIEDLDAAHAAGIGSVLIVRGQSVPPVRSCVQQLVRDLSEVLAD